MVVAAAAGGPIDVFARMLAERMGQPLGQRVVVENVGGGGGTLGGQRVASCSPDGYTTLLGTVATHANPQLYRDKPLYDPLKDFTNIGLIAEIPLILIARKDLPANSFEEFVAYAKANPGKLNYGSAGVGSAAHLGCCAVGAGIGAHPACAVSRHRSCDAGSAGGRIDFICDIAVTAVQSIRNGTVKGLAIFGERSAVLPDLPTAVEKGYPAVRAATWTALFAPRGRLRRSRRNSTRDPGCDDQCGSAEQLQISPQPRCAGPPFAGLSHGFVKSEWDNGALRSAPRRHPPDN